MKKIVLILIMIASLNSCERDDICPESTPTTPRLVIDFYDLQDQTQPKTVTNLLVQGIGNDTAILYSAAESIAIPLRTDASETSFILHKDYEIDDNGTPEDTSDDIVLGNEDVMTFQYDPEDVYVSKACGYKTIYKNVEATTIDDGNNWIELITTEDPLTVDNETTTHVQIFY